MIGGGSLLSAAAFRRMKRSVSRVSAASSILLVVLAAVSPARALVGAEPDARFADRVVMVLMRGGDEAGFCSGLVIDSRTVLTAAHCLKPVRDMAVYYRNADGAPVIVPVERAIAHPAYRPDAIRSRVRSIDVALVRTADPLDPRFVPAALNATEAPAVGDRVILSGYGVTRGGDWKSGGELRSVMLTVREPTSSVLVWTASANGGTAGACSGDSGAPFWSQDGTTAVAVATWAQAPHGRGCGGLTQGPRLAPLRAWIDEAKARLGNAR